MLKHIEEFRKHMIIAGFRQAKIKEVEKFLEVIRAEKTPDVEIQFFDADVIATWQHLYFAALNALTTFGNNNGISKNFAMEIMLFASAQHQIKRATQLVGVKPNTFNVAVLIIGEKPEALEADLKAVARRIGARQDDCVLELTLEKTKALRRIYEISDVELESTSNKADSRKTLVDLVIERMALLATQR